jgi:hypothetical protein
MGNSHTTTSAMLTVVAVLLAANLIVAESRRASAEPTGELGACCLPALPGCITAILRDCTAQDGTFMGAGTGCGACDGACCIPDGSCINPNRAQCEALGGNFQGEGTECTFSPCSIVPVALSATIAVGESGGGVPYRLFRMWNNGQIETRTVHVDPSSCELLGGCPWRDIDTSCAADANGSGDVDFLDLLQALATWGPCLD